MVAALSPSRASDFMQCPLLYRFRVIDKLPSAPSAPAARGTLVHSVLERLFDLPADGRTIEAAVALVEPQWLAML
jgi:RecB family exonuclease